MATLTPAEEIAVNVAAAYANCATALAQLHTAAEVAESARNSFAAREILRVEQAIFAAVYDATPALAGLNGLLNGDPTSP